MILVDVNVLVYVHREDTEKHEQYLAWLLSELDGDQPVALSELVLSGCLRVLTHSKVFDPPTPHERALEFVDILRSHPNVIIVSAGERHWSIFLDLCRRAEARGNLVSDAYHAALAIESGCEWITTDRDYARFPGLKWRHPLDAD